MSKEREIKRFSVNLYSIKEGDKITLLDHQYNEIGNYIQHFDQEKKGFFLSDYEFSNISNFQLQEYLLFQLKVPIAVHAVNIEIDELPLKLELINQVLNIFKKEYEDNFSIENIEEKSKGVDIKIKITQPKRTHYIQQAYLRNFSSNKAKWVSDNKRKKARIFVFDKTVGKLVNIGNTPSEINYGQKIENIAFEEYFYSLGLEKFIADTLEKEIPPIFDKILNKKTLGIVTPNEKKTFTKYLILMWNRPTEAREFMREAYEKGLMTSIEMNPDLEIPENAEPVINEDFLRFQHESQIFRFLDEDDDNSLINRIFNFKWLLIDTKTHNFFYTSDNPVIFYNSYYEKQKSKGNDFIAKDREKMLAKLKEDKNVGEGMLLTSDHPDRRPGVKGVEIYLPISPRYCIVLVDWQKGFKRLKVNQINKQITLDANKYIFSHQSDFKKVREILKSHPDMKVKKGKRSIVKRILKEKKREGKFKFKAINPKEFLKYHFPLGK